MTFKDIFPGLQRTSSFNFQHQSDFPGLSRSWYFQEKNPGLFRRCGNPGKTSTTGKRAPTHRPPNSHHNDTDTVRMITPSISLVTRSLQPRWLNATYTSQADF